jgi:hypothetical protein
MRQIDRDEFNRLREQLVGDEQKLDCVQVTVRPAGHVSIEEDGGGMNANVFGGHRGTVLRVGILEFMVTTNRVVVLRQASPYPLTTWDVLLDVPVDVTRAQLLEVAEQALADSWYAMQGSMEHGWMRVIAGDVLDALSGGTAAGVGEAGGA